MYLYSNQFLFISKSCVGDLDVYGLTNDDIRIGSYKNWIFNFYILWIKSSACTNVFTGGCYMYKICTDFLIFVFFFSNLGKK